jgi:hypothetical protein
MSFLKAKVNNKNSISDIKMHSIIFQKAVHFKERNVKLKTFDSQSLKNANHKILVMSIKLLCTKENHIWMKNSQIDIKKQ